MLLQTKDFKIFFRVSNSLFLLKYFSFPKCYTKFAPASKSKHVLCADQLMVSSIICLRKE